MEIKIIRLNYPELRNESHVELHDTVNKLFVKYPPPSLGIQNEYDIYSPLFDAEVSVLDMIRKSEYTTELDSHDHQRDVLFRGFVDAVKSALNHFDAGKYTAAHKLKVVLDRYGNIATKPLDQETAAIDDLLRELDQGDHPNLITALSLEDWLVQLNIENRTFKDLMEARYSEKAKRPSFNMKTARTAVDKAFHEVIAQFEAFVRVNGPDAYKAFADELNVVLIRYKNIIAQEKGRRNANKNKEDEVKK